MAPPQLDSDDAVPGGELAAHAFVGVLVPLTKRCFEAARTRLVADGHQMEKLSVEHIEWLGWMDMPSELREVWVALPPLTQRNFPTFERPMPLKFCSSCLSRSEKTSYCASLEWKNLIQRQWRSSTEYWRVS